MKQLFLGLCVAVSFLANGQDLCHGAVIPTVYGQSDYFEVIDIHHQFDFSVSRQNRKHLISTERDSLWITKGKYLYQRGVLLAEYDKGVITLKSGQNITEIRTEDGWMYRMDDCLILQVYFSLDRVEDSYYLCFETNDWTENASIAAYIASARFTKSVPMSRISLTAEDVVDILVDVLYFLSI